MREKNPYAHAQRVVDAKEKQIKKIRFFCSVFIIVHSNIHVVLLTIDLNFQIFFLFCLCAAVKLYSFSFFFPIAASC